VLLTVDGRVTGVPYTTPVAPVTCGGHEHLVSAFGEVQWVANARATGVVALSRGTERQSYTVTELDTASAVPVLRAYLAMPTARYVRQLFDATSTSPDEALARDAAGHPVFELTRVLRGRDLDERTPLR
jgi:deazaflavin-dependent oxidoreductase (nitroreductase family)